MAATATALTLSSAARQFSRSASTIFTREVSGSHKLTIDGFSASRKKLPELPQKWWATSQPFEAAGYTWQIKYFPNGGKPQEGADDDDLFSSGGEEGGDGDCISLYLELADAGGHGPYGTPHHHVPANHHHVPIHFKFSLLDLAGNPVPGYSRSREQCVFWRQYPQSVYCNSLQYPSSAAIGFDDFVKWKDLQESGALKDDRFTIRCDITAIRDWSEPDSDGGGAPVSSGSVVVVPPSDLHQQLSDLLWKHKHGADVAIDVAGETFDAHGWLLAARAPVLEAELQALTVISSKKEKEGAARRVVKIKDMEPKVFKAMLHYMYTDKLPQELADGDSVEMARGLLAAARRYKLERLELMCEEALCRRIDVDTVAAILVAAEEHQCQALKAACVEFMARPGCIKAVLKTRGFEEMKATCLPLLVDLLVKQLEA